MPIVNVVTKAVQPVLSRLRSLQTPSRHAPGGARVVASLSDPNPAAALLRELNETIMARSLTFESSGGALLTLDVSGRRVLRLIAANGMAGADDLLAADALEDEHKQDLIRLIQTVAAPPA